MDGKVYKCTLTKGSSAPPLLLRIYGDNTQLLVDRHREQMILTTLSARNIRPITFGFFTNGLVQEFLSARPLRSDEIGDPRFVPKIARTVAQLHKLDVPLPKKPSLWRTIDDWLTLALRNHFDDPQKQLLLERLHLGLIQKEIDELKEALRHIPSPVVLAHHDLLSGNFLYDDDTGELFLIDYEYGMYGYRGFDIGNHFQEYAGLGGDYQRYPSREQQYVFFKAYWEEMYGVLPTEEELSSLYKEVSNYGLVAHIYWGIWAAVQACVSKIDYDYLKYSELRLKEYYRQKHLRLIP
mmetsp:Transcript_6792/g.11138  ORF Transcript_6792/g.11138 Transcript_6792/m.11138 type:complete len:295 (+) Transcript_6792:2-886(+)